MTISKGVGLLLLATGVLAGISSTRASAATVTISPGANIQNVVNANPGGTTFILKPGTYRMQSIAAKNGDIFSGQSGAILSGSELLTAFSQVNVSGITYWEADGPSSPGLQNSKCEPSAPNYPMCTYPEDLFINGKPLMRVSSLSKVSSGKCYFDYAASKIYFVDIPIGQTVERSVTPYAFSEGPSNITVEGLVIEEYATPGQRATIGEQYSGSDWTIQNNEIKLNHSEGVRVGNGGKVLNNNIHDNGQLGVGAFQTTAAILIQNNTIANNNWAFFDITYEAGGAKFAVVTDLTASGNYIHDNVGNGLWCDGDCTGGVYENNTIQNNAKSGISHEVSHAWTIKNNVISGNGFGMSWEWMGGSGIILNESDGVEVADNFVANNYKGIILNMSNRPDYKNSYYDLANDYIHNNIIVTGGANGITGLYQNVNNNAYYTGKNNRFVSDTYCMPSSSSQLYYWWMNNSKSTSSWKAYGQDTGGKWACPGVFLSSPGSGATVSGTVSVNAAAADTGSITKVVFYLDGTELGTSTSSSYSYSWNTTKNSNGQHTLEAQAFNKAGQSSTSSITVTVNNP